MSIRKRESKKAKNGYVYEVRFTYSDHGITKRYQKSGFQSKKEAEAHESFMRVQIEKHDGVKKETKKTLNEVFDEFVEIGSSRYQHNTMKDTIWGFNYVRKELGDIPITRLDYETLQRFFNSRKEEGIETNKRIKKALNRVIKYARKASYINSNPLELVDVIGVVRERTNKADILSQEDLRRIIITLNQKGSFLCTSYSVAILIGYYSGLRVSEALALEKGDVDFESGLISVNKKLNYMGLKTDQLFVTEHMKSKGSKSVLPLPQPLRKALLSWFNVNPYEIICCSEEGTYLNPRVFESRVNQIMKESGMSIHFHFHMLRHTYSTNLVLNHVDLKVAQELMRHSDINTTISIYTHIENQKKIDAVNRVFSENWVEIGSKTDSDTFPVS